MSVLAHGVGSRTDLPIPLGLALYGAGAAILLSFVVLLLFWRTPKLGDASSGRPLPGALQRAADSRGVRRGLQAVALAVAVLITVVAVAGLRETARNLAPWARTLTSLPRWRSSDSCASLLCLRVTSQARSLPHRTCSESSTVPASCSSTSNTPGMVTSKVSSAGCPGTRSAVRS